MAIIKKNGLTQEQLAAAVLRREAQVFIRRADEYARRADAMRAMAANCLRGADRLNGHTLEVAQSEYMSATQEAPTPMTEDEYERQEAKNAEFARQAAQADYELANLAK